MNFELGTSRTLTSSSCLGVLDLGSSRTLASSTCLDVADGDAVCDFPYTEVSHDDSLKAGTPYTAAPIAKTLQGGTPYTEAPVEPLQGGTPCTEFSGEDLLRVSTPYTESHRVQPLQGGTADSGRRANGGAGTIKGDVNASANVATLAPSMRKAKIFSEFIKAILADTGPFGSFIRRYYMASAPGGVRFDPLLPEVKGPFPCVAPHNLAPAPSPRSRRCRGRRMKVSSSLIMENIFAGAMSWLALGSPLHVPSGGPRVFKGIRRTTSLAMERFQREWDYVCCGVTDTKFSGGRAPLVSALRDSVMPAGHVYGLEAKPRSWWTAQLGTSSIWRSAAWLLPVESDGRGEFQKFSGDAISLPAKSAHLPTADLVRATRPDLSATLEFPEDNVLPLDERGTFPRVIHAASSQESLKYFKRKFDADMLVIYRLCDIPHGPDGKPISAALVQLSKGADAEFSRGISDRRLANWCDKDVECPKLAHACQLTKLCASPDEVWRGSISDLPDYFHNLSAKGDHCKHSAEGRPFKARELRAAGIHVASSILDEELCMCCSCTVVMGDKKAVPLAQVAHLQMLSDGGCSAPLLEYGSPVPSADVVAGVVVDDYATFSRGKRGSSNGGSSDELRRGLNGYSKNGTGPKASKLKFDQDRFVVWGGLFDGAEPRVSPSLDKILELTLASLAAVQVGQLSPLGMQVLTGGWGFCMMFKRLTFCLFQCVYAFARLPDPQCSRDLCWRTRSELFLAALISPFMCSRLDCPFGNRLFSHDACGTGGCAFGSAEVPSDFLEELWRFGSVKPVRSAEDAEAAGYSWYEPPDLIPPCASVHPTMFPVPFSRKTVKLFRKILDRNLSLLQKGIGAGQGLFLELWSGTAGLSKAMALAGAETLLGVDIEITPSEDLLDLNFVELVLKLIRAGLFTLVHMGIVCTTYSIAAKPAYRCKDGDGFTQMKEGLSPPKREKVAIGDWFCHLAITIFQIQAESGRYATIENPGSSLLWSVRHMVQLVSSLGLHVVPFDMCAFGASFKKYTKLLCNHSCFLALQRRCTRTHIHDVLAGSVYDPNAGRWMSRTKLAQEYPVQFNHEYAMLATSNLPFLPKGTLSSMYCDSVRVSDFDALDGQVLDTGLPFLSVNQSDVAKKHLTPWEESLEEISVGLPWKSIRSWQVDSEAHINVLEVKAWCGLIRKLSGSPFMHGHRLISLWDSKVGRGAQAKGRSSSHILLSQFRAVLPSFLGAGFEYEGFWIPSPSMPMVGPSRGRRPPEPMAGTIRFPDRHFPLVEESVIQQWKLGKWSPVGLPVAKRRTKYGYRGIRVGESRKPGPSLMLIVCFWYVHVCVSPRPRKVRVDYTPLCETVVDQAFRKRLDAAKDIFCKKFLARSGLFTWEQLGAMNQRDANLVLMEWVQYAFEQDLTYNQAVEGLLCFTHEFFWFSPKPVWRLLRSWRDREPVEVRHPISMMLAKAIIVVAFCWGWEPIAVSFWLAFHGLLRPGEMTALVPSDFVFQNRFGISGEDETICIVRICNPKTRRLGPRRQHVLITEYFLVQWLYYIITPLRAAGSPHTVTGYAMASLSRKLSQILQALGVPPQMYTLGGFRPGGATWEYINHVAIGHLKFRGRWAAESSLEHYIQECVAHLDFQEISEVARSRIHMCALVFDKLIPAHVRNLRVMSDTLPSPPCAHTL